MKKLLAASLVAGISTIVAGAPQANAFTLTSSGTWTGFTPGTAGNVNGIGTDTLSWGFPYPSPGPQSSFKFEGVNRTVNTSGPSGLLPSDLKLGSFTHTNNPITLAGIPITGATLKVDFQFNSGPTEWVLFDLAHVETANKTPCAYPGSGICPDTVTFAFNSASKTSDSFTDTNGSLVSWSLNDFFNTTGDLSTAEAYKSPGVLQFTTDEPGSKVAYLNLEGNFEAEEVPLETDIAGVALIAGLGYLGYRRRQAGKQIIAD